LKGSYGSNDETSRGRGGTTGIHLPFDTLTRLGLLNVSYPKTIIYFNALTTFWWPEKINTCVLIIYFNCVFAIALRTTYVA